jgi:hypothetical protein
MEVVLAAVIGAALVVDTEVVSEEVMLEDTATMAMVWGWV